MSSNKKPHQTKVLGKSKARPKPAGKWMVIEEAADYLGVSVRTMRDYRVEGLFTLAPAGRRRIYFFRDEIEVFSDHGAKCLKEFRKQKNRI